MQTPTSIYDFKVMTIEGKPMTLAIYQNAVMLVVNVASFCNFTPQYAVLEKLYQKYQHTGFVVLGFPCNQFFAQEPHAETEIKAFCSANYHVSFPMFSKVKVNGPHTHPLYTFLKTAKPSILGLKYIPWNFTKFLIDRHGKVIKRFAPCIVLEKLEKDIALLCR